MEKQLYRVSLRIEELDAVTEEPQEVVEEVELATFHSLEEAQLYRAHLSHKCSARATGVQEVLSAMTSVRSFTPG